MTAEQHGHIERVAAYLASRPPARVRTGTMTMHEVSVHQGGEHARVLWQDEGQVVILSSYGDWAFYWSHPGMPMPAFLAKTNRDYLGGKMLGQHATVDCVTGTAKYAREQIIVSRRDGSFSAKDARAEWILVDELASGDRSIESWIENSEFNDAWDMVMHTIASSWAHFWEFLWAPHLVPTLQAWQDGRIGPDAAVTTAGAAS